MATAVEAPDIPVCHRRNHRFEFGIFAKEVLSGKAPPFGLEGLILSINGLFHSLAQEALGVSEQQWVPVGAPDHFYDIPP